MKKDVAILLPSYRRKNDLKKVLKKTPAARGRFIVVANYPLEDFKELSRKYSDRATFIDETAHGKLGVRGAYNEAFKQAKKEGYTYSVLYADDVLPFKKNWLNKAVTYLEEHGAPMGIFSSDEGHYGSFGWNIIKDSPIAHFFIIKNSEFDYLFDERYLQYVIDFEIAVRTVKKKKKILLMPISLRHYRSPLNRESYGDNYQKDLKVFLSDYPEYESWIRDNKEVYIPEDGGLHIITKTWIIPNAQAYPSHKPRRNIYSVLQKIRRS